MATIIHSHIAWAYSDLKKQTQVEKSIDVLDPSELLMVTVGEMTIGTTQAGFDALMGIETQASKPIASEAFDPSNLLMVPIGDIAIGTTPEGFDAFMG